MDIRKINPYLEKKIIKGNTYYQLVRKTRIDGKVKRVWSKYLGTPETIEKVYDGYEEQTSLQLTSFEYGRTAALVKRCEGTPNRSRAAGHDVPSLHNLVFIRNLKVSPMRLSEK